MYYFVYTALLQYVLGSRCSVRATVSPVSPNPQDGQSALILIYISHNRRRFQGKTYSSMMRRGHLNYEVFIHKLYDPIIK